MLLCQIKRKQLLLGCIYFDKLAFTLSSDLSYGIAGRKIWGLLMKYFKEK